MSQITANDPRLRSWVPVPAGSDFPIQNLPFGIFLRNGSSPVAGVAIGDDIVDLAYLNANGYFQSQHLPADIFIQPTLNEFLSLGRRKIREVRERVSELLRDTNDELDADARVAALVPAREVTLLLPVKVANYTDFYSSEEHATNVGSMFRDPKNALLPNWKHLPIGYHGRASSIVVTGTGITRPKGQIKPTDSDLPVFCPTRRGPRRARRRRQQRGRRATRVGRVLLEWEPGGPG
jgi:fumarylacetoacetase